MHYKTIIASDIHVPSPDNKGKEFLQRLKNQTFDQLIFNGDIIDGRHIRLFGWWKRRHSNRLKEMIAIAKDQWVKIIYIMGNHDINVTKRFPRLAEEVDIRSDMIYETGKKKYYICHGHQFDRLEGKFTILSKISFSLGTFLYRSNRIYNACRKSWKMKYHSLTTSIKRTIKRLMVWGKKTFHKKLVKTCKEHRVQGIICGHLHKAEKIRIGRYDYLNSWDRIELCTALVETETNKRYIIDTRQDCV